MVHSAISRRLPVFLFLAVTFFSLKVCAQVQDKDRLSPAFHQLRREALRKALPANSAAVLFSNPVRRRNNDVDFQFSQNPDIYYLTGCIEPAACLVVFSDSIVVKGKKFSEVLFIQGYDSAAAVWTGKTMTPAEAQTTLGIPLVFTTADITVSMPDLCSFSQVLVQYPWYPENDPDNKYDLADVVRLTDDMIRKCGNRTDPDSLDKILATLREIKTPEELALMQKAINLSVDGFRAVLTKVRPGIYEYEAQALFEYITKKGGSEYPGYPSIAGSGSNSCVLHYVTNRTEMQDGDLFLADMGAEYHGYTADITRTMPVNGKFSPEQLQIYDLVLRGQQAGIDACVPGASFSATSQAAIKVISQGLKDLGIIRSSADYRRYFMHGTSHYLGLDVHDAGSYGPLKAGSVITVEPGIYIAPGSPCDRKWWNIGVRIEDDVLITETGHKVMSDALPRTAKEIEEMMKSSVR